MGVYELGGRLYDLVHLTLTLGSEERLKRDAIAQLGIAPGDRVLDWGCGTGLSLKLIEPHLAGRGRIYAVDAAPAMLKRAVARARPTPQLDYHYILRQGTALELPEPVDFVIASYSLGVLPEEMFEPALESIWKCLRAGGRLLIISMYFPKQPESRWRNFYRILKGAVARRFYRQGFSDTLLPAAKKFFLPVSIEYIPSQLSFVFQGKRRDQPDSRAAVADE